MPYTLGEKIRLGWLTAKAAKSAVPYAKQGRDDWEPSSRIERDMDRIADRKEQREQADQAAIRSTLAAADRDIAAAKLKVRSAKGAAAKRAARDEQREAERGRLRVVRAARRQGYQV